MTKPEVALVAHLGVYGKWLVQYGKLLDKQDPLIIDVIHAYADYREHKRKRDEKAMPLMNAIDAYCTAKFKPRPAEEFPIQ